VLFVDSAVNFGMTLWIVAGLMYGTMIFELSFDKVFNDTWAFE
jgi:hypothetical protein